MYAIIGLGNPGAKYEFTRHNVGFLVIDELAKRLNVNFKNDRLIESEFVKTQEEGHEVILVKPQTFMNNSGIAVKALIEKKSVELEKILVICDDFNLDFGQLKIKGQGSDGGHNGLTSIIEKLGTNNFARLRLGIGAPGINADVVQFVLGEFSKKEKASLAEMVVEAADCCLVWLKSGTDEAMNKFNSKGTSK